MLNRILIGLSVIGLALTLSANYKASICYTPDLPDEIVRQDNIIRLLDVLSIGDSKLVNTLSNTATFDVINKVSSMCGDTQRRIPKPEIWSMNIVDNEGQLIFDSKAYEDKTQLYRYNFVFNQNDNKIANLQVEYLYEGSALE
jgi:hypothetical protein